MQIVFMHVKKLKRKKSVRR